MTRPRNGSSSFNASSAPTTAPKNDAAQARNGVSSHPKMRKNRRTQRMGSGASFPDRGQQGGQHEARQKRHREGAQRPVSSGEIQGYGYRRHQRRDPEGYGKRHEGRPLAASQRVIRQHPPSHPWNKGSDHPPDRMVPPVAPAPDLIPAAAIGADILEQHDVYQEENACRAQSDAGRTGETLDGAGTGPETRQYRDRRQAHDQDDGADHHFQYPTQEARSQREKQHE